MFASKIRANALLCAGAAVLLTACGAGTTDPVTGQALQTAAVMSNSADQPAANNVAAAPANSDPRYGADSAGQTGAGDAAGSAANIYGAGNAGQAGAGDAAGSAANVYGADSAGQSPANSGAVAPAVADAAPATAAPAQAAEATPAGSTQPGADGSTLALQTANPAGNIVAPGANTADPAANAGLTQ